MSPKYIHTYRTIGFGGFTMVLKNLVIDRITSAKKSQVWTTRDFLDLGNRDAIDKSLQRLVITKQIRRIDRGLYDAPKVNKLTRNLEAPDYRKIIDAVSRRNQARMLIDGLTAANGLGLTNAVPGQINILTDCRLKPITIDNLVIKFKHTAPSKLYWAGRPAMRVVQALYWLRDIINVTEKDSTIEVIEKIISYLKNTPKKQIIITDLQQGLTTLPSWMQTYLKSLFNHFEEKE